MRRKYPPPPGLDLVLDCRVLYRNMQFFLRSEFELSLRPGCYFWDTAEDLEVASNGDSLGVWDHVCESLGVASNGAFLGHWDHEYE